MNKLFTIIYTAQIERIERLRDATYNLPANVKSVASSDKKFAIILTESRSNDDPDQKCISIKSYYNAIDLKVCLCRRPVNIILNYLKLFELFESSRLHKNNNAMR